MEPAAGKRFQSHETPAAPGWLTPSPRSAGPLREEVTWEEEVEEEAEGEEQMKWTVVLKGEAARGRAMRRRACLAEWRVETPSRRFQMQEEERRVPGGPRCSRSGRWPPECWAGRFSCGSEADSGAVGWTLRSPDQGNAVGGVSGRRSDTTTRQRGNQRRSHLSEAAEFLQSPLPLLAHANGSFGLIIFSLDNRERL